jgi:hypothetical protein
VQTFYFPCPMREAEGLTGPGYAGRCFDHEWINQGRMDGSGSSPTLFSEVSRISSGHGYPGCDGRS